MNNKKLLIPILAVFMFMYVLSLVSSSTAPMVGSNVTVCIRSKACDNILNGDANVVNISFAPAYLDQNWSSVDVYGYSAGLSPNTTLTLLNSSGTDGFPANVSNNISVVLPSTIFEDAADYILVFALWNGSTELFITSNYSTTGINVDNTIPQAPTLSPADGTQIGDSDSAFSFSSTVIDRNTTACTYTMYRAGSSSDALSESGSATYSTTNCSATIDLTDNQYNGEWIFTFTASDGTNTTTSTENSILVNIGGTSGSIIKTKEEKKSNMTLLAGGLVIVAIIIGLLLVVVTSGKKTSKRKR